jgi:glutathione S-transferase
MLVLHHFPQSPFAQKVRSILGYKRLSWHSVDIPMVMPKPDLTALTGGYRRTPVLQIGADVYCDTALICDVLEQWQTEPSLYPLGQEGWARIVAQWADALWFPVMSAFSFQPVGAAHFYRQMSTGQRQALEQDRQAMRGGQARLPAAEAVAAARTQLQRLAQVLEQQPFLLGEQPSLADFSVYHPLWFLRTQVGVLQPALDPWPAVLRWLDRMQALGQGQSQPLGSEAALALAASSRPAALAADEFFDAHGLPLGSRVGVRAESMGTEASVGELVSACQSRLVLRRHDPRAGTVHVHFPRLGFVMTAA